jgi:hypothetical protein
VTAVEEAEVLAQRELGLSPSEAKACVSVAVEIRVLFAEEVADVLLNGNLHALVDLLEPEEFQRWVDGTTASRMRVVAAKAVRMLAAGTLPENARVKP